MTLLGLSLISNYADYFYDRVTGTPVKASPILLYYYRYMYYTFLYFPVLNFTPHCYTVLYITAPCSTSHYSNTLYFFVLHCCLFTSNEPHCIVTLFIALHCTSPYPVIDNSTYLYFEHFHRKIHCTSLYRNPLLFIARHFTDFSCSSLN